MDAFLANPGPYAPTGALSHPIVSRVFAKLNESVPREKYIAFANCPAKQKPKRRFEHKRRKLTEKMFPWATPVMPIAQPRANFAPSGLQRLWRGNKCAHGMQRKSP